MRCHYGSVSMQETLCRAIMSDLFNVMYGYQFVNLCQILPETNALPVYKNFETLHSINTTTKNNNNPFQTKQSDERRRNFTYKIITSPSLSTPYIRKGELIHLVQTAFYTNSRRKKEKTTNCDKKRTKDFVVNTICAIDLFFVIIIYCE